MKSLILSQGISLKTAELKETPSGESIVIAAYERFDKADWHKEGALDDHEPKDGAQSNVWCESRR